jgi:hypothetical protein
VDDVAPIVDPVFGSTDIGEAELTSKTFSQSGKPGLYQSGKPRLSNRFPGPVNPDY